MKSIPKRTINVYLAYVKASEAPENERDLQHQDGRRQDGRILQDAQPLARVRQNQAFQSNSDGEREHSLALDQGRHCEGPQGERAGAPRPKAQGPQTVAAKVAIYARVSTANHGQDVSLQTRELREFAAARGWQVIGEYVDEGVSGAKDSRPELNRLMADAKRRRFDVVLVWKLDRFGRSLRHLVNALAEFESLNIAFVSLSDNLDLSTPSGRLMFQVIAAMSEFERELIRERVRAGMRHAKAKGTRIGRPRAAIDTAEIARLRDSGASWREIAARLGVSVGTVHAMRSKRPPDSGPLTT